VEEMKILIVDDIELNLELLEAMLVGSGHEVESAGNGIKALEKLKSDSFDMIISDILMPKMDGFQLCRECKKDETLRNIPFVFYTATYTDKKDEKFALSLGAEKFMIKPMESKRFMEMIEGVLKDHIKGFLPPSEMPVEKEEEVFQIYSERLVSKLDHKVFQLEENERTLQKRTYDLGERVKELNCLYGISKLLEEQDISLEEIVQEIVNLIPPAWQYPEITCARLLLENHEVRTENFQETAWKQTSDILLKNEVHGIIEVFYLEEKPEYDGGPFLNEEQDLIDSIAQNLGEYIGRQQALNALRESENQVRLLLNSTAEAIYGLDMDGNCTFANKACIQMLGYKNTAELIGQNMHDLIHHLYPDATPYPIQGYPIFQAFQKGEYVHVDNEVLWRADGTSFPTEYWSYPIIEDDQIAGAVVTFMDITERRQAEEELAKHRGHLEGLVKKRTAELEKKTIDLEQANIRLKELDRLKSTFLASMSHELRTPLNSIIGFTGIMLQGMAGEVNEEQRKQLTMVENSASHLLSLINDVLDISKVEAEKVELSLEEFRLDDIAGEVVETLSSAASEKGLKLVTEVPDGVMLFNDKRRMKQVLMNLAVNAVKFTDQGNVTIAARVPGDENLEVRVTDTGMGIKKEHMDKLFQPFPQIDVSLNKRHEGTGLGLHLTKKLVNLLGGDISAKSEYGRGSEFTFTMPLRYNKEGSKSEEDTGS
jgi:PAS domain S-box-containing protein